MSEDIFDVNVIKFLKNPTISTGSYAEYLRATVDSAKSKAVLGLTTNIQKKVENSS